ISVMASRAAVTALCSFEGSANHWGVGRRGIGTRGTNRMSNPREGTRSASRPSRVPSTVMTASGYFWRTAVATASNGLTWPAVPPPASKIDLGNETLPYDERLERPLELEITAMVLRTIDGLALNASCAPGSVRANERT